MSVDVGSIISAAGKASGYLIDSVSTGVNANKQKPVSDNFDPSKIYQNKPSDKDKNDILDKIIDLAPWITGGIALYLFLPNLLERIPKNDRQKKSY